MVYFMALLLAWIIQEQMVVVVMMVVVVVVLEVVVVAAAVVVFNRPGIGGFQILFCGVDSHILIHGFNITTEEHAMLGQEYHTHALLQ